MLIPFTKKLELDQWTLSHLLLLVQKQCWILERFRLLAQHFGIRYPVCRFYHFFKVTLVEILDLSVYRLLTHRSLRSALSYLSAFRLSQVLVWVRLKHHRLMPWT